MDRNTYSEDGYKEMASSDETTKRGNTSGVSIIKSNKSSPHVLKLIPFIYHDISKFETTRKVQSLDSL